MKLKKIIPAICFGIVAFSSCGDPNHPTQTATEFSGSETTGDSSSHTLKPDTVNNANKAGLPDQMVPADASITVSGGGK